ncbi:hypothetical protein [Deinococcus sonorensis]|uniref:Uncharacterized protein n=2 Tax=Deinococcus sonorensis TaxID=309891 RepID=A0AAU7U5M3_9DEIO
MKGFILTALSAVILTGSALAQNADPRMTAVAISAGSDGVSGYQQLYADATWQTIWVPLRAIGGVMPSNMSLQTSGLPDGVSIKITGSKMRGDSLLLTVETKRTSAAKAQPVNSLATITLMSGTSNLTTFQVPVVGVAINK